jgi:hypothetical protein
MTFFQIFIGLLLVLSWAGRPILYKPAAKYFPPSMSPAFTSAWLLIALLLSFPLLGHLIYDDFKQIFQSPFVLFSIYKGATLFYLIKYQQIVNKESTSSSVFLSFIALAIGALANNLFFNEGLPHTKIYSILGLGLLGLIFFIKGDAGRLSPKSKLAFIITTLIMASYTISDHLGISQIGWYPHLLISSVVMFIVSLLHGISKQDFKNMFTSKNIVYAGIFYATTEFLVIYTSINILPVSIVAVFLRLSVPVVMVYSAIRYKEQSLKNQLSFAIIAILLALPIILIKG